MLKGTNQTGLNMHVVPALLHALEHLPHYVLDVPTLYEVSFKLYFFFSQVSIQIFTEKYKECPTKFTVDSSDK